LLIFTIEFVFFLLWAVPFTIMIGAIANNGLTIESSWSALKNSSTSGVGHMVGGNRVAADVECCVHAHACSRASARCGTMAVDSVCARIHGYAVTVALDLAKSHPTGRATRCFDCQYFAGNHGRSTALETCPVAWTRGYFEYRDWQLAHLFVLASGHHVPQIFTAVARNACVPTASALKQMQWAHMYFSLLR